MSAVISRALVGNSLDSDMEWFTVKEFYRLSCFRAGRKKMCERNTGLNYETRKPLSQLQNRFCALIFRPERE